MPRSVKSSPCQFVQSRIGFVLSLAGAISYNTRPSDGLAAVHPCFFCEVSTVLEAYRKHVEERAAEGVVPKPLSAEQVSGLIDLLKNPPKGEEQFLLELMTHRVPAGVDPAAYVKAGFLTAIVKGEASSPLIDKKHAVKLLGTMLGGYNITTLVQLLDDEGRRGWTDFVRSQRANPAFQFGARRGDPQPCIGHAIRDAGGFEPGGERRVGRARTSSQARFRRFDQPIQFTLDRLECPQLLKTIIGIDPPARRL